MVWLHLIWTHSNRKLRAELIVLNAYQEMQRGRKPLQFQQQLIQLEIEIL
uniref:Uncharacterized protein n=1 Tax=Phlebotomus papatasi TaxID=29031 RepID=A0A1B0DK50_PHLPP